MKVVYTYQNSYLCGHLDNNYIIRVHTKITSGTHQTKMVFFNVKYQPCNALLFITVRMNKVLLWCELAYALSNCYS